MYLDINTTLVLINIIFIISLILVGGAFLVFSLLDSRDKKKLIAEANKASKFDYDLEASKLKLPSTPVYLTDFEKIVTPVIFLIDQSIEDSFNKFKAEYGRRRTDGVLEYYMSQENAEKIVVEVCKSVRESLSNEFILSMNRYLSIEGFGKFVNTIVINKVFPRVKEMNTTIYNPHVKQSLEEGKEKKKIKEIPNSIIQAMTSLTGLTAEEIEKMKNTDELYATAFKGLNNMGR